MKPGKKTPWSSESNRPPDSRAHSAPEDKVRGAGIYMGLAFEFLGYLAAAGGIGYFAEKEWGGGRGWIFLTGFAVGLVLGIFHLMRRAQTFAKFTPRIRPPSLEERTKELEQGFRRVDDRLRDLSSPEKDKQ